MSLTFGRRYSNGPLGSRGSGCSGATEDVIDQSEELWIAKTRLVLMVFVGETTGFGCRAIC